MTPERLKKVEEIYHEVLEIKESDRTGFLSVSCGDDADLRFEVESLLYFDNSYNNLIDSSPKELIREVFSNHENSKLIGTQINQYKILSLLGEGGMGTVFLAQDTKLERKVAIKFLSEEFASEGTGLTRFSILRAAIVAFFIRRRNSWASERICMTIIREGF